MIPTTIIKKVKSNFSCIANFKYTNLVEICPLCKDDLLYLPPKLARNLGNISRTVLVKNVTDLVHIIDPLSGQTAAIDHVKFWRDPIRPIITAARSRLTRFVVLGKEPVVVEQNVSKRSATRRNRNKLALVTVAKEDDLGVNDRQVEERSHVGYLLKSGDVCLGYDLNETQFVDDEAEKMKSAGKLPDVILVRKLYGGAALDQPNASKTRIWQMKRLDVEVAESLRSSRAKKDAELDDMDEEDFMREVEADKEMRKNMNLYKSEVRKKKMKTIVDNTDGMETDTDDNAGAIDREMSGGSASAKHEGRHKIEDDSDVGNSDIDDDDEDPEDDQKIRLDELLDNLDLDAEPDNAEGIYDEDEPWGMGVVAEEGEKAAKDGITYTGRDEAVSVKDKDSAVLVQSDQLGGDVRKKFGL